MSRFAYGGQALIEGVLMRGRFALAVALRHPDGSIVWATERLDSGLRARRILRVPFVRGLVVLYDTLVTGTRWLVRSATLAAASLEAGDSAPPPGDNPAGGAPETPAGEPAVDSTPTGGARSDAASAEPEGSPARQPATHPSAASTGVGTGFGVAIGLMLLVTLAIGIGVFFLAPLFLASVTVGRVDSGLGLQLTEGLIRVLLFVGYLLLIARTPDVRRVFQYHGAEHMSIHAFEAGDPLTPAAARRYPTAHPRCGTEFLVVVLIISILAFALVGRQSPLWMVVSRVALIPVIAAVSYEVLQFGARHRGRAIVRWLWEPGIWVQKITTRQPTDDMLEVAIVSLERALIADGREVPAGSANLAARPLDPALADDEAAWAPGPLPDDAAAAGAGVPAAPVAPAGPAAERLS